jgi:hypothetical protein
MRVSLVLRLLAYLAVVVAGVVGFTVVQDVTDRLETSQDCTEEFLVDTVETADRVVGQSGRVAETNKEQNQAWADYVKLELGQAKKGDDVNEKTAIRYVEDYFKKLSEYIHQVELQEIRNEQDPFPTRTQYRNCLAGKTQ